MKIKEQLKLQSDIEVPYHVWTAIGNNAKKISIMGHQASLTNDSDYKDIAELRKAIEWYADQLGGKIKWEK